MAPVRLDQAQLAYLSACRTAAIDTENPIDEAIYLTSAFQLAGFPHVVGILWEIDDQIDVTITDAFYTHLRTPPEPPTPAGRPGPCTKPCATYATATTCPPDSTGSEPLPADAYLHVGARPVAGDAAWSTHSGARARRERGHGLPASTVRTPAGLMLRAC
ncbi:CHAT domain-containing protein [Streptomyces noursei]|uniref:CHAT domain-containing protein n=1 Tax=Streptomyces noursei TaxID=1971 RepID=UPI0037D9C701